MQVSCFVFACVADITCVPVLMCLCTVCVEEGTAPLQQQLFPHGPLATARPTQQVHRVIPTQGTHTTGSNAVLHYRVNWTLEITSDAPTNAGKHVSIASDTQMIQSSD